MQAAARDDEPPRAHRRGHRHGQDEDAAAHRRAALGAGRARLRRRREGRRVRRRRPRRRRGPGAKRDAELGIPYAPTGFPAEYLSIGGIGPGIPVRATVSDFGPALSAKVLGANETQESSLELVFRYADAKSLPLLDLADLRALLDVPDSDEGKAELEGIGGVSKATVGVLLRNLVTLEDRRRDRVLRRAEVRIADLMRTGPDGRGVISAWSSPAVQDKPALFSTVLMWLLAELFETAARGRRPRQAQARLLLRRGAPALRRRDGRVPGVRRADRADHPLEGRRHLLRDAGADGRAVERPGQLGNRVQHALRAFTPDDPKALPRP